MERENRGGRKFSCEFSGVCLSQDLFSFFLFHVHSIGGGEQREREGGGGFFTRLVTQVVQCGSAVLEGRREKCVNINNIQHSTTV